MEGISISKRYYWKKIRIILLILAFVITWALFMLAITSNRNGNMTIYIDKTTATKTLSLSESSTLANPAGKLYGPSLINAWDEKEDHIPAYSDLLDGDRSKNEGVSYDNSKRNYLAYTFYLFNSGSETLDYEMSFNIEYVDKEADSMIRVRVYEDDELTTYAKPKNDGEAEYRTTAFESENTIVSKTYQNFEVNQVRKYSIVIWIDADDPDTTNDKIGGSIVLSIRYSVL